MDTTEFARLFLGPNSTDLTSSDLAQEFINAATHARFALDDKTRTKLLAQIYGQRTHLNESELAEVFDQALVEEWQLVKPKLKKTVFKHLSDQMESLTKNNR